MDKHTLPNISIIGSGRVAKSLGAFFLSKGVPIKGIYSRNKETECDPILWGSALLPPLPAPLAVGWFRFYFKTFFVFC